MVVNRAAYWVWLQQTLGYANNKIRTVNLLYKDIEDFYSAGVKEWRLCGCFTDKQIEAFKNYKLSDANKIISRCKILGIDIIPYESDKYPERLKNIANPPCVLYIKGKLPDVDNMLCISVVGTRDASTYGIKKSFEFGYELAKAGAIVVSGGALGIDSQSHKGAIQAGGITITVLGCGINTPYLMGQIGMRNAIAKNGAVISEYPPDYPAYPRNFPIRNRIISGLSLGTLVIEAGEKSGSLITANLALEQNRDVFALSSKDRQLSLSGTDKLIRDGAKQVCSICDILEEYEYIIECGANEGTEIQYDEAQDNVKTDDKNKEILSELSEQAILLYNTLKSEPVCLDELSILTKINPCNIIKLITELEIYGLICSHSGNRYSLPL